MYQLRSIQYIKRTIIQNTSTTSTISSTVASPIIRSRCFSVLRHNNNNIIMPSIIQIFSMNQQLSSYFSTTSSTSTTKYAVVHHGDAYEKSMNGLHGQQLSLAQLEGIGKDDPDFDPFLEEELEEARRIAEQEQEEGSADNDDEEESDDDDEYDEEYEEPKLLSEWKETLKTYKKDGSVRRNKSESAILRAGAPAGGYTAVIALGGSQYKVTTDDLLIINKLKPISKYTIGSVHTLTNEHILLLSSTSLTIIGMPYVSQGAEVDIMIEESTKDSKIIIFKKRRRKNSKRKNGFRRDVTMIRILDIRFPKQYANHVHMERPDPAPLINHNQYYNNQIEEEEEDQQQQQESQPHVAA